MPARAAAPALLALTLCLPVAAQERPREEDLFGAPPAEAPAAEKPGSPPENQAPPAARRPGEAEVLGGQGADAAESRVAGRLKETENPLQIGGQLYLRLNAFAREDQPPSQWGMNSPNVLDLFLDARPSERLRGYTLVRAFYDPTQTQGTNPLVPVGVAFVGKTTEVALDQLWMRFDVGQRAFVTAGKQHVKWGTGRVWNPTDFLHTQRRDPLAVFDTRGGTYLARVAVPIGEQRGGLMAAAVLEPLAPQVQPIYFPSDQPPPPSSAQLGAVGGAARAEVVLGEWEFGADAVAQRGMKPRAGLDVSGGLWELDLRGEMAFRTGSDVPALRPGEDVVTIPGYPSWQRYQRQGLWIQAVGSADWSTKYSDEDTLTIGAEYFYNQAGYDDISAYPYLFGWGAYVPFYLGRHYLALSLLLPKPGSWNDTTITLTGIANLSDRSGVVRLDWSTTFLTWLRFEWYVQGHLGQRGGEFRFAIDIPPIPGSLPNGLVLPPPTVDAGVAMRVAL
ncbi:MAG TPA: hypothetical protein VFF02_14505 [Anaeromyxobacteraceae bacterium]|nr:hypothetical protein [Anaeromyxobacteraceae bacterium]